MNFHSASRWLASSYTCFPALASHNNWDLHLAQLTLCVAWHSRSNKQMMKLHYNQDSESCVLQTQSFLMNYEHMSTSLTHMDASDTVHFPCVPCVSFLCFWLLSCNTTSQIHYKDEQYSGGCSGEPKLYRSDSDDKGTSHHLTSSPKYFTALLAHLKAPAIMNTKKKWKYAFVLSEAVDISQIVGLL